LRCLLIIIILFESFSNWVKSLVLDCFAVAAITCHGVLHIWCGHRILFILIWIAAFLLILFDSLWFLQIPLLLISFSSFFLLFSLIYINHLSILICLLHFSVNVSIYDAFISTRTPMSYYLIFFVLFLWFSLILGLVFIIVIHFGRNLTSFYDLLLLSNYLRFLLLGYLLNIGYFLG